LLVCPASKQEKTPVADWARLGAGEVGSRRNPAEEDKKVPESLQEVSLFAGSHWGRTSLIELDLKLI
jgi:hypothetical protein